MTVRQHGTRVILLMGCVAGLLGWVASRESILFADGLRYIAHAQRIDRDLTPNHLLRSTDHPAYPLLIVATHHVLGGVGPQSWQRAAQAASVLAGVLLVVPLYLIAAEVCGGSVAWLAVALSFLVPLSTQVMADTLSESLFLLSWSWGVWCGLRFLRHGGFGWLPALALFAALAYWVRPEGLLLPVAMVGTLALVPLLRTTRMVWPRWWAAVAFLVIGPACLVAPIIVMKGGISTKPAVGRLLGTTGQSAATAVERQRPLEPGQTPTRTLVLAVRAVAFSIRDAVTVPLIPFAILGLVWAWPFGGTQARAGVFLSLIVGAWTLALVRLHATSGYCTPRHAMIVAYPLIALAALGLDRLWNQVTIPGRWLGIDDEARYSAGPLIRLVAVAGLVGLNVAAIREPLNDQFVGYRGAADYLRTHVPSGSKVVDPTGFALFYGERTGYTFANLVAAKGDPSVQRVVVRDAHLAGGWWYCDELRELVKGRTPVASFPANPRPRQPVVFVYDWSDPAEAAAVARSLSPTVR